MEERASTSGSAAGTVSPCQMTAIHHRLLSCSTATRKLLHVNLAQLTSALLLIGAEQKLWICPCYGRRSQLIQRHRPAAACCIALHARSFLCQVAAGLPLWFGRGRTCPTRSPPRQPPAHNLESQRQSGCGPACSVRSHLPLFASALAYSHFPRSPRSSSHPDHQGDRHGAV